MLDKNLKDILKIANELGIDYELDSDDPGFFVVNNDGTETKITLETLLDVEMRNCNEKTL